MALSVERFDRNLRSRGWTVVVFALAGAILFKFAAALIVMAQPKLYESVAVIDEGSLQAVAPGDIVGIGDVQSARVVDELDLAIRWGYSGNGGNGRHVAIKRLREAVTVRRSEDGKFTAIVARDQNAQDARDVARTVAKQYAGWPRWKTEANLRPEQAKLVERRDALKRALEKANQDYNRWLFYSSFKQEVVRVVEEGLPVPDDPVFKIEIENYKRDKAAYQNVRVAMEGIEREVDAIGLPAPARVELVGKPEEARMPISPVPQTTLVIAQGAGAGAGVLLWLLWMLGRRPPDDEPRCEIPEADLSGPEAEPESLY